MQLWLPIIIRVAREHSILARGELVDPFDRHRGPTDVSHFFTLPLFDGTPLFSQKSTPKPIGRFRTHVIMSRFTNGCFADRSFPFEGFGKRFVEQLVSIDLISLIVFFFLVQL